MNNQKLERLVRYLCSQLHTLLLVFGVGMCFMGIAQACSCSVRSSPCGQYQEAKAVFAGLVTNLREKTVEQKGENGTSEQYRVGLAARFEVEEAFKGIASREIEIVTGGGGGDCGYEFKLGKRSLVYAFGDAEGKNLITHICTRTSLLEDAQDDVAIARAYQQGRRETRIFGNVSLSIFDAKVGTDVPAEQLGGVKVTVQGDKKVETVTDELGRYRVVDLPPGRYKVRLLLSDEYSKEEESEVLLKEGGCAEANFYPRAGARIKGRLLDHKGEPLSGARITVRLAPVASDGGNPESNPWMGETDENGYYEVEAVPPGRYLLGVNIFDIPRKWLPYPPTYYPGVREPSEANIITVSKGQRLDNLVLRLGTPLTECAVNGVVKWSDGRPAVGAVVTFFLSETSMLRMLEKVKVDEQGRFKFQAYEGLRYRLEAFNNELAWGNGEEQTKPIEFTATKESSPVEFVVPLPPHELPTRQRRKSS